MSELGTQKNTTPINNLAKQISNVFAPMKSASSDLQNFTKKSIVNLFDNAFNQTDKTQSTFNDAQKLLQKTLDNFNKKIQELYA